MKQLIATIAAMGTMLILDIVAWGIIIGGVIAIAYGILKLFGIL